MCVLVPDDIKPWNDVKASAVQWFAKYSEKKFSGASGSSPEKIHTYFGSICPTAEKGPKKFKAWIRELVGITAKSLPVDEI